MIDAGTAEFLRDGLGIHIATRSARMEPNGARAVAVAVEQDGVHLLVYVPEVAAARVLPDLEDNGLAAVVCARPVDDRACQVKGTFAGSRCATEHERAAVMAQWERFMENLERIGIPRQAATGWATWPCVAVRLRATAIFDQTPGANAGAPLA